MLEDAQIYVIRLDKIGEILHNPKAASEILTTTLNTIIVQRQITKSILFEDAKGRIANFLIELAREQDLNQNATDTYFCHFL